MTTEAVVSLAPPTKRLLTQEEVAFVRKAAADGLRRDDIAKHIGVTPFILTERLRDQLGGLRLKRGRKFAIDGDDPTPDEIEIRKIDVRAKWSRERWLLGRDHHRGPPGDRVLQVDAADMDHAR